MAVLILPFVPSLFLMLAITVIPRDWPAHLTVYRVSSIAVASAALVGLWWLVTPDYSRSESLHSFLFLIAPYVFTGIATFLIQAGFRTGNIDWRFGLLGLALLIAVNADVAYTALLVPLIGLFTTVATSLMAIAGTIWMAATWAGVRKVMAVVIGVVLPISFFGSQQLGEWYSLEPTARRNGVEIAGALNRYRADTGRYPTTLDKLAPKYLSELKEPGTMWGWLYSSDSSGFTLAYVSDIDKDGYVICKYLAGSPSWQCPLDHSTAPFVLSPTPEPTSIH